MSYRLFKKYYNINIVDLNTFLNKLRYVINSSDKYISNDEIKDLFITKRIASLCLIYPVIGYFRNEHYINNIIKSYQEFKDLDSKILTDNNWLVDYIEKNFKYDMNYKDLESFRQ